MKYHNLNDSAAETLVGRAARAFSIAWDLAENNVPKL